MPGVRLTLSEDATPSQPTILITQSLEGEVNVNVLGVHKTQGLAVAALLHDIANGLQEVFVGQEQNFADPAEEGAHGTHLDAENVPADNTPKRPKFAPHA